MVSFESVEEKKLDVVSEKKIDGRMKKKEKKKGFLIEKIFLKNEKITKK